MRLFSIAVDTTCGPVRRIAVEAFGAFLDLTAAYALLLERRCGSAAAMDIARQVVPSEMLAFLRTGSLAFDSAEQAIEFAVRELDNGNVLQCPDGGSVVHAREAARVLAPVLRPNTIRDFITFRRHIENSSRLMGLAEVPPTWFELPVYYKGSPDAVAGPDDPILWPRYTERLDYELEFGVFIGRPGKDIAAKDAKRHIAGYTIFNDVSARDMQGREMALRLGPGKGKDFDNSNIFGPCLVTPDEIPDAYALAMHARVNGETWSSGNSNDMHFAFEDMIAHVSRDETLWPGDFFGSGTVGGGCGLELDRWIAVGDIIELEVEKLGVLRNPVTRASEARSAR